jgi:hypothetical protein
MILPKLKNVRIDKERKEGMSHLASQIIFPQSFRALSPLPGRPGLFLTSGRNSLDINPRFLYLFLYVNGLNNARAHYHDHQPWRVDWIVRSEQQTTQQKPRQIRRGFCFPGASSNWLQTTETTSCKTWITAY